MDSSFCVDKARAYACEPHALKRPHPRTPHGAESYSERLPDLQTDNSSECDEDAGSVSSAGVLSRT
jgi:hypothetical protein